MIVALIKPSRLNLLFEPMDISTYNNNGLNNTINKINLYKLSMLSFVRNFGAIYSLFNLLSGLSRRTGLVPGLLEPYPVWYSYDRSASLLSTPWDNEFLIEPMNQWIERAQPQDCGTGPPWSFAHTCSLRKSSWHDLGKSIVSVSSGLQRAFLLMGNLSRDVFV